MDRFAETENIDYRLLFANQAKQTSVSNGKRKPRRFFLIRLPFAHHANGSLLFVRLFTKKKKISVCRRTKRTCPSMLISNIYTVQCIYIDTANRDGKESFNFGYRIDPISDQEISD
jgi:hypothetical protein